MTMTDEAREERALERSIDLTTRRYTKVLTALTRKGKTIKQIAAETGFSPSLVGSTLRSLQEDEDAGALIVQTPMPGGHEFRIGKSWDEAEAGMEWFAAHLRTRANTLVKRVATKRAMLVAAGKSVPTEWIVAAQFAEILRDQFDTIVSSPQPEKPTLHAKRAPHLIG